MNSYLWFIEVVQSKTIQCGMLGWMVNSELEKVWDEAVDALFEVIFRYLPGRTEEDHKKPGLNSQI
jgi:hypothetical protein